MKKLSRSWNHAHYCVEIRGVNLKEGIGVDMRTQVLEQISFSGRLCCLSSKPLLDVALTNWPVLITNPALTRKRRPSGIPYCEDLLRTRMEQCKNRIHRASLAVCS